MNSPSVNVEVVDAVIEDPSRPLPEIGNFFTEEHEQFAQLRAAGIDGKKALCKVMKKRPSFFSQKDEKTMRMWETNRHMMARIEYLRNALIVTNDSKITKDELVGMLSNRIRVEYHGGKTQDFVILAKMIADICGFNVPSKSETTIRAYVEKSDEELRKIIEGK